MRAGFLEGGDRSWFILSFSRKFLGVMVNRMVFFYVYVIAERFTSDFGESLLPVLFFPPQSPKNTPMIHDLIQDSQVESENKRKRSRNAPKGQRAHSPGPSARSLNACQLQVNTCACLNDLILEEQKKEKGCAVNLLTTQPLFSL